MTETPGWHIRKSGLQKSGLLLAAATLLAATSVALSPDRTRADEGGVSFWVPGQFGSLAALPGVPGWALGLVNYYTSVSASGNVAAAREVTLGRFSGTVSVNLNATLTAKPDIVFIAPSYTFATPVFGGQLAVSMTGAVGRSATDLNGTLTVSAASGVATFNSLSLKLRSHRKCGEVTQKGHWTV